MSKTTMQFITFFFLFIVNSSAVSISIIELVNGTLWDFALNPYLFPLNIIGAVLFGVKLFRIIS